jgi:CheY-like chemotaxis protein
MTNNTTNSHPNDAGNNSQALDGLRILVVDDDADTRILITYILESFNCKVMTASSVMEAIEIIGNFRPNLLISDIAIPVVSGYTLIEKVRSLEPPLGKIPALAVTGVDTETVHHLVFKYGFQAYLIKPIEPDELILQIAKLVQIQPKNQQLCQNSDEIISTDESLYSFEFKQVDKLVNKRNPLNKDLANKIITKSQKLRNNAKQLQIRYNNVGCRFVAFKAHFAQTKEKLRLIKLYQNI